MTYRSWCSVCAVSLRVIDSIAPRMRGQDSILGAARYVTPLSLPCCSRAGQLTFKILIREFLVCVCRLTLPLKLCLTGVTIDDPLS